MRTTIDAAGRLVVPKALRERARIAAGGEVEVTERDGVIEIVPVPVDVEVVATAEGPVAVAGDQHPALTDAEVRAAIDRVRR
jgi:AbrB family looped-hinge helix DNA binding protein